MNVVTGVQPGRHFEAQLHPSISLPLYREGRSRTPCVLFLCGFFHARALHFEDTRPMTVTEVVVDFLVPEQENLCHIGVDKGGDQG